MGMADHWVRLGMALALIALVSMGMYSAAGRANAVGPYTTAGSALPR